MAIIIQIARAFEHQHSPRPNTIFHLRSLDLARKNKSTHFRSDIFHNIYSWLQQQETNCILVSHWLLKRFSYRDVEQIARCVFCLKKRRRKKNSHLNSSKTHRLISCAHTYPHPHSISSYALWLSVARVRLRRSSDHLYASHIPWIEIINELNWLIILTLNGCTFWQVWPSAAAMVFAYLNNVGAVTNA